MSVSFTNKAIAIIAEDRIREAMEQGKFDNLPGTGKPLRDLDDPVDEFWWLRKWFQRERLNEVKRADAKAEARLKYQELNERNS